MTADEFRSALRDLGDLSESEAAQALGINARTVRRYKSGECAVPKLVELALDGLQFRRTINDGK